MFFPSADKYIKYTHLNLVHPVVYDNVIRWALSSDTRSQDGPNPVSLSNPNTDGIYLVI